MNILRLRFPLGSAATRRRMVGLPITFLFVLICLSGLGASRTETFKKFTESPPPLRELIYRMQSNEFGTNPVYFEALWQTNAFSLRSASTLERLRAGIVETSSVSTFEHRVAGAGEISSVFNGHYESNYWFLHGGQDFEMLTQPNGKVGKDDIRYFTRNSNLSMSKVAESWLSSVMNFGPSSLEIGSIRWNGERFKATNSMNVEIDGKLISKGGTPIGLEMTLTVLTTNATQVSTNIIDWHVAYSYTTNLAIDLPDDVKVTAARRGAREHPVSEFQILSILPADGLMGPSEFDPTPLVRQNKLVEYHVRQDGIFHTNADGSIIAAMDERPKTRRSTRL